MRKIKVVTLGPTLHQQGGIATVENLILKHPCTDIKARHIPTHDEGSVAHRIKLFVWALVQFSWLLLQGHVDVVHLHVSEKGSVFRKAILVILSTLFGKSVIMHTHGCEFHLFYDNLPTFGKHFVSWIFEQCAYVITLSKSWKDYYIHQCHLSPDKVLVLHNPVELPEVIPQRGDKKTHFVFLGRIGARKGAFDLIQAFANLSPQHRMNSHLTLAGDGSLEEAHKLIKELNLQAQVTLPGWINYAQRNDLLQQASVFVLPSYNEGLPMAMLEAMAWELPIIATPVGGIPNVILHKENGLLVEVGNVNHLSQAMQILIDDPSLRFRMGANARQRVTPLNLPNYYTTLLAIYRSAVAGESAVRFSDTGTQVSNLSE
jgi:glycosyltransferase involved in cell wall biosynthesis